VAYARATIGNWPGAVEAIHESLEILERRGSELGIAMTLEATAAAAAWTGDHQLAERLFGKADEVRRRLAAGPPIRLVLSQHFREKAMAEAGAEWERLFAEGEGMSTLEAAELARRFEPQPDTPPMPGLGPPSTA
jgi:hypothetical protein